MSNKLDKKIRLGMVGVRPGISSEHIKNIIKVPYFEIKALCDKNKEHVESVLQFLQHKPAIYTNYIDMLKEDLDAVVISTPNFLHRDMAVAAFEAGFHVFCEKPMANTLEACDDIIEAQKKSGKFLQIGMHRRYNPLYRKVKEIIDKGEIGKLKMLWGHEFRGDWKLLSDDPEENARINWRYSRKLSGGTVIEKICHDIDLFNMIIDRPALRVFSSGGIGVYTSDGRDTVDHLNLVLEYEDGVSVNFMLSLFTPHNRIKGRHYGIIGTEGNLEILESEFLIYKHDRQTTTKEEIKVDSLGWTSQSRTHPASIAEWVAFGKSLKEGKTPFCDGEKGREAVKIGLACEESINTGKVINI